MGISDSTVAYEVCSVWHAEMSLSGLLVSGYRQMHVAFGNARNLQGDPMQLPSRYPNESRLGSARANAQLVQSADRIDSINKIARLVQADEHSLLQHGIQFGRELCQLKRAVGHGNWQPLFSEGVFDFHVRKAQRYMRLYRRYKELKHDAKGSKQLTVTQALEVLAEPLRYPEQGSETGPQADTEEKTADENQQAFPAAVVSTNQSSETVEADESTEPTKQQLPDSSSNQPPRSTAKSASASSDDEWLTPDYIVGPLIELFGDIDLDPASNTDKHIPAKEHFTAADDGLRADRPWHGKVFLNPPRTDTLAGRFVYRLAAEHKKGRVDEAVVLLEAKTDTPWFRQLRPHIRSFLAKPEFAHFPGVPDALVAVYLGSRVDRFCQIFRAIGDIYTLYRPVAAE